jgi:radical SAM protein with 4Fe4S-binding SPASM domain
MKYFKRLGFEKLFMNLDYIKKALYLVPKFPNNVDIEITNRCNLNCGLCKRKQLNLPETDLGFSKFKRIIERIKPIKEISLGGFGEPLLHRDIFRMIAYAKSKGIRVAFTTNGYLLLNKNIFGKLVDSNVERIDISIEYIHSNALEGHPQNPKLLEAIERFIAEKNRLHRQTKVWFNTIVLRSNFNQLLDIIHFAEKIKVDKVQLLHLDKKSNDVTKYVPIEQELTFYKKLKNMSFKIEVMSLYDWYMGIRKFAFRCHKCCPMTYSFFYITIDGDVTPCCFGLPRYKIANIFEHDLKTIWNSKAFKSFRKNQEKVCKGCTIYKLA